MSRYIAVAIMIMLGAAVLAGLIVGDGSLLGAHEKSSNGTVQMINGSF